MEVNKINKIITISHCILNQNTVVDGLQRAKGPFPFVSRLIEDNISIIQLPCPEFGFLGIDRPPMTYEEYSNLNNYRDYCRNLLRPIIEQLLSYPKDSFNYLGIIGINESPNCSISKQRGVLMEEFFSLCEKNNLSTKYIEVPAWYSTDNQGDFLKTINKFLEGK